MKECKRCGKTNVDVHACAPFSPRSNCCDAKVKIAFTSPGGPGAKYWNQCQECKRECEELWEAL